MCREKDIGFEVKTLNNLLKRYMDDFSRDRGLEGVTGMHGWIIAYLYQHQDEEVFQRDIEREFTVRRSTATTLLQLMEKKGLLVREPVDYDARLKRLVLTEKAVEYHRGVTERIRFLETQLRKGLTEQEVDEFLRLIRRIQQNAGALGG
ncbi:MAG: MarR family transcriptional regulator [Clostridiales bacterium]|nr:MarR family transcriptional regulator [Clostridiales bacterium]